MKKLAIYAILIVLILLAAIFIIRSGSEITTASIFEQDGVDTESNPEEPNCTDKPLSGITSSSVIEDT